MEPSEAIVLAAVASEYATAAPIAPFVGFNRQELNALLAMYGRMVARGEWRDYAIDMLQDRAVFSVFRRSSERPIYRVEKVPRLARRQGRYMVVAMGGLIVKRGHDLKRVLQVVDRRIAVVPG